MCVLGAGINLILILIFNWIYERVAYWLTEKELRYSTVNQTDPDPDLDLDPEPDPNIQLDLYELLAYWLTEKELR